MISKRTLSAGAFSRYAVPLAFALCLLLPSNAQAVQKNKKNQPATGRIEVSTQPGGYPIIIDGQTVGETTDYISTFELPPGAHTVEIQFPNTRWSQVINIIAGRRNCIAFNYRPRTIDIPSIPVSPCPYPVNVTAPAQVGDGDIVTFTAEVGYEGQSALTYRWTVSPPAARILSGVGTPTITVDSSGLGNRRVTAILVVDDGSGDRSCRQTAQASTAVRGLSNVTTPLRPDESPSGAHDDDQAWPDKPAVELQGSPDADGPQQTGKSGPTGTTPPDRAIPRSRGRVEVVDLGDTTGIVCDCGATPKISKVPWWKRAAGKLKPK